MKIQLDNVAKKFNKEWIFQKVNLKFEQQDTIAVTGPNGSGKSTFLQVVAGSLLQTEGKINYRHNEVSIPPEKIYRYLSMVAPAMTLPEDLTLAEFIRFHFKFKTLKAGHQLDELPSICKLEKARDKFIKNFSTGMKQRLKLGIAFYADAPLLLLDEPATNLDTSGIDWYLSEIEKVMKEKMIFVCSNRKDEYDFCKKSINILAYK